MTKGLWCQTIPATPGLLTFTLIIKMIQIWAFWYVGTAPLFPTYRRAQHAGNWISHKPSDINRTAGQSQTLYRRQVSVQFYFTGRIAWQALWSRLLNIPIFKEWSLEPAAYMGNTGYILRVSHGTLAFASRSSYSAVYQCQNACLLFLDHSAFGEPNLPSWHTMPVDQREREKRVKRTYFPNGLWKECEKQLIPNT